MRRAPAAVFLLAILAVSLLAVGTGVSQPAVETVGVQEPLGGEGTNTSRMLNVGNGEAGAMATPEPTVTTTTATTAGVAETHLDTYAVEAAVVGASADEREQLVAGALDRTEDRLSTLASREQAARGDLRADEIDHETYLRTLGRVNKEVGAIEDSLTTMEDLAAADQALQDRVGGLKTRTVNYVGPLTDDLGSAVTWAGSPAPVFVAPGENGFVLSRIESGLYYREALLTDARDDELGSVDIDVAQEQIGDRYPWTWANKGDFSINTVGEDVFRFQLSHDHGTVISMLDTSAGAVYGEVQTKSLSRMPVGPEETTTEGNLTLAVSTAAPGEPVRVQVTNATGDRVPATITVEGRDISQADLEEAVWFNSPAEPFVVRAESEDRSLSLEVTPRA